jgi:hypothetical protein
MPSDLALTPFFRLWWEQKISAGRRDNSACDKPAPAEIHFEGN